LPRILHNTAAQLIASLDEIRGEVRRTMKFLLVATTAGVLANAGELRPEQARALHL
jgi:hypothetical protein